MSEDCQPGSTGGAEQGGRAPFITACDVDADAITIAKENAELNGVDDQIDSASAASTTNRICRCGMCKSAPVIVELLPALI